LRHDSDIDLLMVLEALQYYVLVGALVAKSTDGSKRVCVLSSIFTIEEQ
jgi:hypothetical protein